MRHRERGAALGIAMLVALVATIASYATLIVAVDRARQARFYRERLPARYAAEAGIVWAQQQLWSNPAYCGTPDPPLISGMSVDVTVSNCIAGSPKTISAKVVY